MYFIKIILDKIKSFWSHSKSENEINIHGDNNTVNLSTSERKKSKNKK